MDYIPMNDLAVMVLLLVLAAIIGLSALVGFAALFEDVQVRPMTEDEFHRLISRPPSR